MRCQMCRRLAVAADVAEPLHLLLEHFEQLDLLEHLERLPVLAAAKAQMMQRTAVVLWNGWDCWTHARSAIY